MIELTPIEEEFVSRVKAGIQRAAEQRDPLPMTEEEFFSELYAALVGGQWLDERAHSAQWAADQMADVEMRMYLESRSVGGTPGRVSRLLVTLRGGGDPLDYQLDRAASAGNVSERIQAFLNRVGFVRLPEREGPL